MGRVEKSDYEFQSRIAFGNCFPTDTEALRVRDEVKVLLSPVSYLEPHERRVTKRPKWEREFEAEFDELYPERIKEAIAFIRNLLSQQRVAIPPMAEVITYSGTVPPILYKNGKVFRTGKLLNVKRGV